MAQRESRLSRSIRQALEADGYFCFKVHGSEMMRAGLPDLIVCAMGMFIGLEVKNPGQKHKIKEQQERVAAEIVAAGGRCGLVSSVGEARLYVRQALGGYV